VKRQKRTQKEDIDAVLKKQDERAEREHRAEHGWTTDMFLERPDCEICTNPMIEKFDGTGKQLNEMRKHRDSKRVTFFTGWNCGNMNCKNFEKLIAVKKEYEVRNTTDAIEFKLIKRGIENNRKIFGGLKK